MPTFGLNMYVGYLGVPVVRVRRTPCLWFFCDLSAIVYPSGLEPAVILDHPDCVRKIKYWCPLEGALKPPSAHIAAESHWP